MQRLEGSAVCSPVEKAGEEGRPAEWELRRVQERKAMAFSSARLQAARLSWPRFLIDIVFMSLPFDQLRSNMSSVIWLFLVTNSLDQISHQHSVSCCSSY